MQTMNLHYVCSSLFLTIFTFTLYHTNFVVIIIHSAVSDVVYNINLSKRIILTPIPLRVHYFNYLCRKRVSDGIVFIAVSFGLSLINPSIALASTHIESQSFTTSNLVVSIPKQFPKGVLGPYADQQSPAWELARQKRTAAIKKMAEQGIIKVDTDDTGSQFLSLPWIPNQKIKYKSLSLQQQLLNEVCAGAFGEIFKDTILHGVDTYKTRSQQVSTKKKKTGDSTDDEDNDEIENKDNVDIRENPISSIAKQAKDLYAGFPVVATSSIPQGAAFFFAKKSVIEAIQSLNPAFGASFIGQTLPIIAASSVYWGIRKCIGTFVLINYHQSKQIIHSIN